MGVAIPSQDVLRTLFNYDPETGVLTWRSHPRRPSLNGRVVGGRTAHGYWRVTVGGGGQEYAHRVIWKLVYGYEPDEVDHINRDGSDNRLANLREASRSENERNIRGRGRLGVKGVTLSGRPKAPYQVQIMHNYKQFSGGRYATLEDAEAAAVRLRERLHGPFARHS